jgi:hypothetical protein
MNIEDIQYRLTYLYEELNAAENDLFCFSVPSRDSGEENWVRDQERYIESLKSEITLLTSTLN